jgi:hypothetical protein
MPVHCAETLGRPHQPTGAHAIMRHGCDGRPPRADGGASSQLRPHELALIPVGTHRAVELPQVCLKPRDSMVLLARNLSSYERLPVRSFGLCQIFNQITLCCHIVHLLLKKHSFSHNICIITPRVDIGVVEHAQI